MPSENTRRIAKNTGFLYVRMLLTMGVAFYTSRVVLNALGVEDYGSGSDVFVFDGDVYQRNPTFPEL